MRTKKKTVEQEKNRNRSFLDRFLQIVFGGLDQYMALNPSNSSNLEQLELKGLTFIYYMYVVMCSLFISNSKSRSIETLIWLQHNSRKKTELYRILIISEHKHITLYIM